MTEYSDVPAEILTRLRAICSRLPESYEEPAWAGARWRIRKRTFAHVITVDGPRGPSTVMSFRCPGEELDALRATGHPFFRPGWGTNVMGIVFGPDTDWDEVAELVTDSYCIMAPKKLAKLVGGPVD